MKLYDNIIKKREENKTILEENADQSVIGNKSFHRIESPIEDAQSSLIYILECFGQHVDRIYGVHTVQGLVDTILDSLGMMYNYETETAECCKKRTDYILAFRKDGKSVALIPGIAGYRYYCPSDSSVGAVNQAFISGLKDGCYVLCRPLAGRKTVLDTFLWNVLMSLTATDIARLLLATGLVTALGMIIPMLNRWIYKVYMGQTGGSELKFLIVIFTYASVVLARAGITMVKKFVLSSVKVRVSTEMQAAVMSKVLHLPNSFFKDTSSGKLSRRFNSCVRLSDLILDVVMDVLLDTTFSFAYLFQLKSLAPVLFAPALIFIVLKLIVSTIGAYLNMRNEARVLDLDMDYTGFLNSSIRGIQKVKGLGAEVFIYAIWADMYRRRLALAYKKPFFLKYNAELLSALTTLTTIALIFVSIENGLKSEDYLTFMSSLALVMGVINSLTDIMQKLFLTNTLCNNIRPIFEAETEESKALEYVHRLRGSVRVENIRFSYDNDPRGCLNGITLDIKDGEKIAIVGESGCGKSTLLKILIGLEKPQSGSVFYDGKSLASLNQKSLRRHIGSVFQFSKVFPGTISDNISFGNDISADEKTIWEAADRAVIGDFIRTLPLQLYTEISETNSCGLSGGQRQQILLARAMMDKPGVLILDEATSALDNVTQSKVLENILQMKSTVIMVAHRLSTIEHFDRIILMDEGKIAEEGTYEELMSKNDRFANLVRKQMIPAKQAAI